MSSGTEDNKLSSKFRKMVPLECSLINVIVKFHEREGKHLCFTNETSFMIKQSVTPPKVSSTTFVSTFDNDFKYPHEDQKYHFFEAKQRSLLQKLTQPIIMTKQVYECIIFVVGHKFSFRDEKIGCPFTLAGIVHSNQKTFSQINEVEALFEIRKHISSIEKQFCKRLKKQHPGKFESCELYEKEKIDVAVIQGRDDNDPCEKKRYKNYNESSTGNNTKADADDLEFLSDIYLNSTECYAQFPPSLTPQQAKTTSAKVLVDEFEMIPTASLSTGGIYMTWKEREERIKSLERPPGFSDYYRKNISGGTDVAVLICRSKIKGCGIESHVRFALKGYTKLERQKENWNSFYDTNLRQDLDRQYSLTNMFLKKITKKLNQMSKKLDGIEKEATLMKDWVKLNKNMEIE